MGPTTWTQVFLTALFVLPGFVYRGVRSRLRGPHPDDRELSVRIFRALGVSIGLGIVYIAVLGGHLTAPVRDPQLLLAHPRPYALAAGVLIFLLPAVLGVLAHAVYLSGSGIVEHWWTVRRSDLNLYDNTPTAWDFGFRNRDEDQFVRVLTSDNVWIGGLADSRAFATAYPEPRELYLPVAHEMGDDGSFGPQVTNTAGVWISCADVKVVQFLKQAGAEDDEDVASAGGSGGEADG